MVLEKLFKRTKTGGIQVHSITVSHLPISSFIYKEIGKLNGKMTQHIEEVCCGKQKRTVEEQANFMAKSDWTKKRDEGYKSLADLNIEDLGSEENIPSYKYESLINHDLFNILNLVLPEFNTDANGNVKPMLAQTFDAKKTTFPGYAQPKLDGVRCLMIIDFITGEPDAQGPRVTFLSRKGKEYDAVYNHIGKRIKCLLSWDRHPFKKETLKPYMFDEGKIILDGELYSQDISFQSIVSAVKAYNEDTPKIKFVMYDFVSNLTQKERISSLVSWKQLMLDTDLNDVVEVLLTEQISNSQELNTLHDKWVSEGYEGAMYRNPKGIYGQGQRSSDLLKYKAFDETEFDLVDLKISVRVSKPEEEATNSLGVVDLLAVIQIKENETCEVTMAGSSAYKRNLYLEWAEKVDNNKKIKYKLTVKHFGYTETNRPRIATGKAIRDYE